MKGRVLDLRPRCKRCGKIPRGKMAEQSYKMYQPFCSYHCQQWYGLEEVRKYLDSNKGVNVREP
jgi:hypothetical protein